MSLQQNWESIYGASFKKAYHRILEAHFDYVQNQAIFKIGIYCTKEDRNSDKPPLFIRKVVTTIDETKYILRGPIYDYLKTTNNYQESTDV
jgi:hypothetical protein